MRGQEIELKFPVGDPARLQAALPGLGFVVDTPRTLEQNTLFDTEGRALREAHQLLRIRRYGELWTLTHKRQPQERGGTGADARYKVRIETETHLDDGEAMGTVLEELGFRPVFRYEKYRTEWSQGGATIRGPLFGGGEEESMLAACHLVIDETPIGNYAELEGAPGWIDETLARLGVDPASCITESYGRLFLAWKERTGSAAENLSFDEVANARALEPAGR